MSRGVQDPRVTSAQRNYLERFASGEDTSIALGLVLAEAGVPDPREHPLPGHLRIIDDLWTLARVASGANWRYG